MPQVAINWCVALGAIPIRALETADGAGQCRRDGLAADCGGVAEPSGKLRGRVRVFLGGFRSLPETNRRRISLGWGPRVAGPFHGAHQPKSWPGSMLITQGTEARPRALSRAHDDAFAAAAAVILAGRRRPSSVKASRGDHVVAAVPLQCPRQGNRCCRRRRRRARRHCHVMRRRSRFAWWGSEDWVVRRRRHRKVARARRRAVERGEVGAPRARHHARARAAPVAIEASSRHARGAATEKRAKHSSRASASGARQRHPAPHPARPRVQPRMHGRPLARVRSEYARRRQHAAHALVSAGSPRRTPAGARAARRSNSKARATPVRLRCRPRARWSSRRTRRPRGA